MIPNRTDERDGWKEGRTYVVGHQRPDTDAIASALGYAWFLAAMGAQNIVPARAGQLPAQTTFALEHFGCAAPGILSEVAPLFWHITQEQRALTRKSPLSEAMEQMAQGHRVVPVLDDEKHPLGVVTPIALARVYAAISRNPGNAAKALSQPCQEVLEEAPTFRARQRISDHRRSLLRSSDDDFLVTDDAGFYLGVAARGEVVEPPRARLILVDHNELGQAVAGAEEAEIVAVLDHHRLGNAATTSPISFLVEPVGSTSTLVAEQCRARNLTPPPELAGVLLSGLLSDTLVFRSPTTTPRDQEIAAWLAGLTSVDIAAFGEQLLRVTPGLAARASTEILDGDRKNYEMGGQSVSVGQVEVTNLQELPERREELLQELQGRRERESLALIALMVTDVVTGTSHLLAQGESSLLSALPFAHLGEGEWDLGSVVSRKKQLVPALFDVVEK